jgi:hypothetical protein
MEIDLKQPSLSCYLWFCLLALVLFPSLARAQTPAPGEWTWVGGSNTAGGPCTTYIPCGNGIVGVYGTLGTAAAGNIPGSRSGASTWTDSSGNFWLYGGLGFDSAGMFGELGDLWEFNASTGEWAWINGSSTIGSSNCSSADPADCFQPAEYGTFGVSAVGNTPGGRDGAATWIDSSGHLWLFGGNLAGIAGTFVGYVIPGELNDLWEFDPSKNEWAWMGGENSIGTCFTASSLPNQGCFATGVYGTLGTAAAGNTPGGRINASTWIDSSGHLWLFGGSGYDAVGDAGFLNDLWKFDPLTDEWTWMGGSNELPVSDGSYASFGVYGALGTSAAGNIPGGRSGASTWADGAGHFWLFGGGGGYTSQLPGPPEFVFAFNDLWEFIPSSNEWAWMGGSSKSAFFDCVTYAFGVGCSESGQVGVYGTLGAPAAGNMPGSRFSSATWMDGNGHVWLFGGTGFDSNATGNFGYLNDLWEFDPPTNEWTWMGGSSTLPANPIQSGVYGTLGTPAPANIPPTRANASSWADQNGHLWMFAGAQPADSSYGLYDFNDLWEYEPPASAATPAFSVAAGTYNAIQSVTISDSTAGATVYYTTDGSAPSMSSTLYSGSITVASTETLQAVAIANSVLSSAVASAAYTINVPPDFSIAAAPASMTVAAGGSGTASISMSAQGGFASAVTFSCSSGLPAGASCSFSPASVTPPGTASTTVTVTTSATTASLHPKSRPMLPDSALAIALCCLGWKKRRRLQMLVLLAVSVAGLSLLSGCGGGSSGGAPSGPQPVTSTLTVTATSGSLSHSTTISLTVN